MSSKSGLLLDSLSRYRRLARLRTFSWRWCAADSSRICTAHQLSQYEDCGMRYLCMSSALSKAGMETLAHLGLSSAEKLSQKDHPGVGFICSTSGWYRCPRKEQQQQEKRKKWEGKDAGRNSQLWFTASHRDTTGTVKCNIFIVSPSSQSIQTWLKTRWEHMPYTKSPSPTQRLDVYMNVKKARDNKSAGRCPAWELWKRHKRKNTNRWYISSGKVQVEAASPSTQRTKWQKTQGKKRKKGKTQ